MAGHWPKRHCHGLPTAGWFLAVDVTCWLRPDAHTSPERILCHTYGRRRDQHTPVPAGPTRSSARSNRAAVRGPRPWTHSTRPP
ncbi:transposase [Streptomyces sp. NPDC050535]|uniref:transposase n=1 Tax=Streptomyces sp. NPDC050535 TaxID=3365626 RepID=UPI003789C38E